MSEDKVYKDGDIVWVKLGNNWWPGEVTGPSRHPEGLIKHLKRVPYCVVKFFNENSYEYIRSAKQIFPFQCTKKDEFLKKGYSLYNSGNSFMEKFPEDVEVAERLTLRKESSLIINNRPDSIVKAILGQPLITTYDNSYDGASCRENRRSGDSVTKILNITQNRNNESPNDKQGLSSNSLLTSNIPLNNTKYVTANNNAANTNTHYQCNLCDFTSVRQNVMILHRKMHSNRNSIGSNSATSFTKSSTALPPPPPPTSAVAGIAAAVKTIASTAPTTGVKKNVLNQNQIINKEKTKKKTKVSTTTKVVSSSEKGVLGATETTISTATSKELDNTQASIKTDKSKSCKLNSNKKSNNESKAESAYDTILSDFCPSETEMSPISEEKKSRRSLRNRNNSLESAAFDITNGSPICIDISETKSIQKIPKKRDFSSLQLQKECKNDLTDPDVCIIDKTIDTTTTALKCTNTSVISSAETQTTKKDAEDLRKILLADWSDDDDSPVDAIVVEDSIVVDNAESNECIAEEITEPSTSAVVVLTSTPVVSSIALSTTARIRNIPKKDRRDVVLQDFNSDLSLIQDNDKVAENRKSIAVDLDSSNSSVVEIIEDDHSAAPIITINDDEEELDATKSLNNQNSGAVCESKDSDFVTGLSNHKSNSAATSCSTLSCFDFQEEEDEQETAAPTISHFKKKYLSSEKLQNASSADDLEDENVVKSRAEVAERDQKLTAEIESLLAQTKPAVTDLLNVNSLEESISVKDLPIKERGKRIFKSRNKSRIEEKSYTETVISALFVVDSDMKTSEQNNSKENSEIKAITHNEKETSEVNVIANAVNNEVILEVEQNLISNKIAAETSSQELPTYLENASLPANENKENEDISKSENNQKIHVENDQMDKEQLVACEEDHIEKVNITDEIIQNLPNEKNEIAEISEILTTNTSLDKEVLAKDEDNNESGNQIVEIGVVVSNDEEIDTSLETVKDNNAVDDSELDPKQNKECIEISKVVEILTETEQEITALNREETAEIVNSELLSYEQNKTEQSHDSDNSKLSTIESNILEVKENTIENEISENSYKIRVKPSEQLFEQEHDLEPEQGQDTLTANDVRNVDARIIATTPTDENSSMGASDTGAEFGSPTSMLSEERLPAFRFESNQTPQPDMDTVENVVEDSKQTFHKETNDNDKNNVEDTPFVRANLTENHCPLMQRRFSMNLNTVQNEAMPIKRPRLSVDESKMSSLNNLDKTSESNSPTPLSQYRLEVKSRPKSRHMKITPRRNVSELFKVQINDNHNNKNKSGGDVTTTQKSLKKIEEIKEELSIENAAAECLNDNENNIENIENNTITIETVVNTKDPEVNKNCADQNVSKEDSVLDKVLEHEADSTQDNRNQQKPLENDNIAEEIIQETPSNRIAELPDNGVKIVEQPPDMDSLTEVVTAQETQLSLKEKIDISNTLKDKTQDNLAETDMSDMSVPDNHVETSDLTSKEDQLSIILNIKEDKESNIPTNNGVLSSDKIERPFSPGVPPPTPQEREIVIECDNQNLPINDEQQQQQEEGYEKKDDIYDHLPTPKKGELLNLEIIETVIPHKTSPLEEIQINPTTLKTMENKDENPSTATSTLQEHENETIKTEIPQPPTPEQSHTISESEYKILSLEKDKSENQIMRPSTPQDNEENVNHITIPSTTQLKDIIIECEPETPQSTIECDHNLSVQITPENEVIIESEMVDGTPSTTVQEKDIIIEENLQLEEKESLIERELQEMQPKETTIMQEVEDTQPNVLQTDADKAAEEFLIEFDSIVNHNHSVEEDTPNNCMEEVINAEELINNIIEEVHEDHQLKQDTPKVESPASMQYESDNTYTVIAPKPSWNQVFKESFTKQSTPAKRRQTICFEISGTKEGVACKKQALDFESVLPVNKTLRRCAERKLTLPAIETKPSNNNLQHGLLALNHNQLTSDKKLIPASKRKLSIEDNITSFIIERPKQQQQTQSQTTSGPPPLQRIRPLSRQGSATVKTNEDNIAEPTAQQSHDNLYEELFYPISASPTPSLESSQRPEGARVIHQQILSSPAVTTSPTKPLSTDTKTTKNKQIGVDSRGNKYVIIKTPPTDIIVQPTLPSSPTATATASNNFGTTITIQPLPRNNTEVAATTKSTKNKSYLAAASSIRKQQQQQQQMKQIAITVPAKSSPVEIAKSSDVVSKTVARNRRKTTQTKALTTGVVTTNSNINSAKHKQAMEALSRRLSIASEAPPLAKLSKTSTTHVQTQLSNSSNLTTFFGDTQISNIAQQQLMHLQQQQQQQQPPAVPLPPPIILNKNAHQQSVIQRKPRKIAQQQQSVHHQQTLHQQQQQSATKTSQLLQLQQQQAHLQQQQQQLQQQFITQITTQQQLQQQQQHNLLQPPPLQQIQPQPVQVQQQQIVQPTDGILITATTTDDDNVIDSNTQLIALPTQPYPGYSETFLLCKVKGNTCKPVDNVPLYLNHDLNELVPVPLGALEGGPKSQQDHQIEIKSPNAAQQILAGSQNSAILQDNENNLQMANITCTITDGEISSGVGVEATEHNLHQHNENQTQQQIMEEGVVEDNAGNMDFSENQDVNSELIPNNGILLNIEGQQVLLDAATFAHLLANPEANTQLISDDGTEYVLTHEVLAALQMQQEQQQALELANAASAEQQQQQRMEQTSGSDIIAVALAGSDLYDNDVLTIDTSQGMQLIDSDGSIVFPQQTGSITQQHLTPPAVVTNAVLDQSPIMSTLEVPSSIATGHKLQGTQLITVPSHHLAASSNAALGGRSNLEDSLAAIGVTTQSSGVPASLGLPITVTNPNIASKVTSASSLNEMLHFVSHRPATAAATAAAVAAAALAGESRIFTD